MGFDEACAKIQELYLAGDKKAAIAAVPTEMVEAVALIGPADKIRDDLAQWDESVVDTLMVSGPPAVLRQISDVVTR